MMSSMTPTSHISPITAAELGEVSPQNEIQPPVKKTRKNLTTAEKRAVIAELLKGSTKGSLAWGDFARVAALFNTNRKTVSKLWKHYESQKANGVIDPDLGNKRKGNSGRKGVDLESLREELRKIPPKERTSMTQRALAETLGMPHSTLSNHLKKLGVSRSKSKSTGAGAAAVAAAAAPTTTTTALPMVAGFPVVTGLPAATDVAAAAGVEAATGAMAGAEAVAAEAVAAVEAMTSAPMISPASVMAPAPVAES